MKSLLIGLVLFSGIVSADTFIIVEDSTTKYVDVVVYNEHHTYIDRIEYKYSDYGNWYASAMLKGIKIKMTLRGVIDSNGLNVKFVDNAIDSDVFIKDNYTHINLDKFK